MKKQTFRPVRAALVAGLAIVMVAWEPGLRAEDEKKSREERDLDEAIAVTEERKAGIQNVVESVMNRAKNLMNRMENRERKVDPFGLSMDPSEKVVQQEPLPVDEVAEELTPRQLSSLHEALEKFHVTGVVPKRKEVIVGARNLRVGDEFIIQHNDVSYRLKIADVTVKEVVLLDTETGEKARVDLGILPDLSAPEGVSSSAPDSDGGSTEGIVPLNSVMTITE